MILVGPIVHVYVYMYKSLTQKWSQWLLSDGSMVHKHFHPYLRTSIRSKLYFVFCRWQWRGQIVLALAQRTGVVEEEEGEVEVVASTHTLGARWWWCRCNQCTTGEEGAGHSGMLVTWLASSHGNVAHVLQGEEGGGHSGMLVTWRACWSVSYTHLRAHETLR